MQIYFTVKESIEKYVELGKNYPFPPPPIRRCHQCNKTVQYKKHGFYKRYLITTFFKDKIFIRRYICPLCLHTISYLPNFSLPRFIYAAEHIFTYIYNTFLHTGTLKSCLDKLNALHKGLNISRQVIYHYKKRFVKNLKLIQMGLRQINPQVKLPDEKFNESERAKMLLSAIKDTPDQERSFTQKFYQSTNKTYLALCK